MITSNQACLSWTWFSAERGTIVMWLMSYICNYFSRSIEQWTNGLVRKTKSQVCASFAWICELQRDFSRIRLVIYTFENMSNSRILCATAQESVICGCTANRIRNFFPSSEIGIWAWTKRMGPLRDKSNRLVNLSQISQISIIYDALFSPANSSEPTLAATFGTSWQGSTCTVAAWSFNCPLVRKIGKTYRILSIFIDKFTSLLEI